MGRQSLENALYDHLGVKPSGKVSVWKYSEWLEYFRNVPAANLMASKDFLQTNISAEGFAAASRWIEIFGNPKAIDKLYRGRLKAQQEETLVDLALADDDEAFYEALIKKTALEISECTCNTNEIARLTMNLRVFKKELHEIRSKKLKKGSVLEKTMLATARLPKPPENAKKAAKKPTKKKATKPPKPTEKKDPKA